MTENAAGPDARLIDYGHLLDLGDYGAYAQLFTADGELMLGPLGRAKGRQQIQAMMTRIDRPDASFHLITSPLITLGDDTAVARVIWSVINQADDGTPSLGMVGHHEDELVREEGR